MQDAAQEEEFAVVAAAGRQAAPLAKGAPVEVGPEAVVEDRRMLGPFAR
ncbi:hypothetical protein ACLIYP_03255 [Streptomyces nanhaiensis]